MAFSFFTFLDRPWRQAIEEFLSNSLALRLASRKDEKWREAEKALRLLIEVLKLILLHLRHLWHLGSLHTCLNLLSAHALETHWAK